MNNICPIYKTDCNHGYPTINNNPMRCCAFSEPIAVGYEFLEGYIDHSTSCCKIYGSW